MTKKEIGCTQCPFAGHIELKECPDAYTEVSQYCGIYNHEPLEDETGYNPCEDCHRKYNGWGISREEAERIERLCQEAND